MSTGIGIGAIHCVLPADRAPVAALPELARLGPAEREFVASAGVRTVGVFPDTDAADLAARACRELLAGSGKDSDAGAGDRPEPDLLIMVSPRAPDTLIGSDAARVQATAGLDSTFTFAVDGLGCAGASVAWALARDLLVADPARDSILIAFASRPAGTDRIRYPVTVIGDGAFAMTMVRSGRPALRAHRMWTDGTFHDLFHIDYKRTPWREWREECRSTFRYSFELAMHSRLRLGKLVDAVLADAGITRDRVAATVMQNVTASAYDFYEHLLGLPIHPLCRPHLAELGHLGAMDVVLNLDRLLATGAVTDGDLVLVLNNSPVAWAVTLWEI